jgi:hypothetical protein
MDQTAVDPTPRELSLDLRRPLGRGIPGARVRDLPTLNEIIKRGSEYGVGAAYRRVADRLQGAYMGTVRCDVPID